MSSKPWIDAYEPRQWAVYQLPTSERLELKDVEDRFLVCGAESQMALSRYEDYVRVGGEPPKFFFWDFEQMAADRDRTYGMGELGELLSEWNGHAAGSLVLMTFEGIDEGKFTYLVAKS